MDGIYNKYFCKFSKIVVLWPFPDHVAAILFYVGNDISAYIILKCRSME